MGEEIVSAAETQQNDSETLLESQRKIYENLTLKEAESYINGNLVTAARVYVANGYFLKRIRDDKLFQDDGYQNFEEYVRDRYGKDKGWASKCIKVNNMLSVGGDSPCLDSRYQDYTTYQLVELAYMDEEQREQATPDKSVKQLYEMRKPKEAPYFPIEGQLDLVTDFPEVLPDDGVVIPQLPGNAEEPVPTLSFAMDVTELVGGDVGEETDDGIIQEEIPENEPKTEEIVQEVPISEPEATIDDIDLSVDAYNCLKRAGIEKLSELRDMPDSELARIRGLGARAFQQVRRLVKEYYEQDTENQDVIDAEFEEIPVKTFDRNILRDMIQKAQETLDVMQDYWKKSQPDAYTKHIMELQAYQNLLETGETPAEEEPEPVEQPELPVLKNNDQRKEWLNTFHDWPVWFRVPEADEIYYRYDLPDGSSFVICEYQYFSEWRIKYADENPECRGTREYLLTPGYHYLDDCKTNRSAMVEKLKETQRIGGVGYVRKTD